MKLAAAFGTVYGKLFFYQQETALSEKKLRITK
jgi:hypothetical protein